MRKSNTPTVNEQINFIVNKIITLEEIMIGFDKNLDEINNKVGGLEERFGGLEERFGGLEERFGGLEERQKNLTEQQTGFNQRLEMFGQLLLQTRIDLQEGFGQAKKERAEIERRFNARLDIQSHQLKAVKKTHLEDISAHSTIILRHGRQLRLLSTKLQRAIP